MDALLDCGLIALITWVFVRFWRDIRETNEHIDVMNALRFQVIEALRSGDKHGYELQKWLKANCSVDFLSKGVGPLYPVLHRMEEEGLVSTYVVEESGRVRRYYHLISEE